MNPTKEELISMILPDDIGLDGMIELIELGTFGVSLESIRDSEVENIWDCDNDTIIMMMDDTNGWNEQIKYVSNFMDSMKFHLCEQINVERLIGIELWIYADMIFQQLDCIPIDELIEIAERLDIDIDEI